MQYKIVNYLIVNKQNKSFQEHHAENHNVMETVSRNDDKNLSKNCQ